MSKIYEMNLQDAPFQLILSAQKDVEMRLCKNGREEIKKDDIIVFSNKNGNQIKVLVVDIKRFLNFVELYDYYDKTRLGYKPDEDASPDDMLIYYTKEDILKYGVLGIEIKLVKE